MQAVNRPRRRFQTFLNAATVTFALAQLTALALARADEPQPVAATLIEQRILAQQGLSIGLATIILESQVEAFVGLEFYNVGDCNKIPGGGGFQIVSRSFNAKGFAGHVKIFFDDGCNALYLDETLNFTLVSITPTTYSFPATIGVYSKAGAKVATLSLTAMLSTPTAISVKLAGIATLSPTNRLPAVQIGLTCEIPFSNPGPTTVADAIFHSVFIVRPSQLPVTTTDIDCVEGIAQNFPIIGMATASVTPMTLHLIDHGTGIIKVTFSQTSPGKLSTGAIDALSVAINKNGKVLINGVSPPYGFDTFGGEAANFVLFPPKPTLWDITDSEHNAKFSIALDSNTTRTLTGKIAPLAGGTALAAINVDQSGSGFIIYSNGLKAAISGWAVGK
jgi:hypothetical protein